MIAGEDLDKSGFAGAVITEQTYDFVLAQAKVDILERLDFSKGFGHISEFEAIFFWDANSPARWVSWIFNG